MQSSSLDISLKLFETEVTETLECMKFVEKSLALRPVVKSIINPASTDRHSIGIADSFSKSQSLPRQKFIFGLFVTIHSSFEKFIRNTFSNTLSEICATIKIYDDLPEKIKKENIHSTGVAFHGIHTPNDYANLDYYLMSKNIGSCLPGSDNYVVNSNAMSLVITTFKSENIFKLFSKIGIDLNWPQIAKTTKFVSLYKGTDAKNLGNRIQETLDEYVRTRNRIVHTGEVSMDFEDDWFLKMFHFYMALSYSISADIKTALSKVKVSGK